MKINSLKIIILNHIKLFYLLKNSLIIDTDPFRLIELQTPTDDILK